MLSSLCMLFFFFFFKQKTAYEIKECDWSSDVCSSDLGAEDLVVHLLVVEVIVVVVASHNHAGTRRAQEHLIYIPLNVHQVSVPISLAHSAVIASNLLHGRPISATLAFADLAELLGFLGAHAVAPRGHPPAIRPTPLPSSPHSPSGRSPSPPPTRACPWGRAGWSCRSGPRSGRGPRRRTGPCSASPTPTDPGRTPA